MLSQYVDAIVVRAKQHQTVVELASYCTCSVINGLTDIRHPCQALADLYTLSELVGPLAGRTLAYIGDGNNVARSLPKAAARWACDSSWPRRRTTASTKRFSTS